MTELSFHFNVASRVDHACRLLRKAVRSGATVVVTADPATLTELDNRLWTFSATDFLPHAYLREGSSGAAPTPVVLLDNAADAEQHDVLLNLGRSVPPGFERFARLIEVVGLDDDGRRNARARWKHYADRGYQIERFDLQSRDER